MGWYGCPRHSGLPEVYCRPSRRQPSWSCPGQYLLFLAFSFSYISKSRRHLTSVGSVGGCDRRAGTSSLLTLIVYILSHLLSIFLNEMSLKGTRGSWSSPVRVLSYGCRTWLWVFLAQMETGYGMRYAVISDIHANEEALKAVLQELGRIARRTGLP